LLHDWMDIRIVGCLVITNRSGYKFIRVLGRLPPQSIRE
jgi:hypothetical protein